MAEAQGKKCPYSQLFWSAFFPHFSRKMRTRITRNTDAFYAVKWFINIIITRVIVIDTVPLTVLFCNFQLIELWLSAVKRYQCQFRGFVGLIWLTSNHTFCSGNFLDKSLSCFMKNLKQPLFYPGNFKIFKNALGKIISSRPTPNMWLLVLTDMQIKGQQLILIVISPV